MPYSEPMKMNLGFAVQDTFGVLGDPDKEDATRGGPASVAGLKEGDELLAADGQALTDRNDFVAALQASRGNPVKLTLRRGGETLTKTLTPKLSENGSVAQVAVGTLKREVTRIDEHSEAYQKGLRSGNFVYGFIPTDPNASQWTAGKLLWGKTRIPADQPDTLELTALPPDPRFVFTQERIAVEHYRAGSVGEAISVAWDDTIRFSTSVFAVLRGLLTRDVSTTALSGPGGIARLMYRHNGQTTFMKYFWFLGFISLNLGVMQFIPIPLLDGFHLLMVFVENQRQPRAAQGAGSVSIRGHLHRGRPPLIGVLQ